MASNVIRNDVVKISFQIDNSPLKKLNDQMNNLKSATEGASGGDTFKELVDGSKKAKKGVKEVTDESKKLNNDLKKVSTTLKNIAKKAGGAALNGLKKIAGISFKAVSVGLASAATGIAAMVKQSVSAYGELEQLEGGVKKIFDEADISKIMKDANGAYKDLGLSASEYLGAINNVGATFAQTMGDQKGYDTARKGMLAVSDYASGTGKNINLLNEKFQMITRSSGSYQSIADQFAGLLPQTSADFLKQAKAAGYLTGSYSKLTDVPIAEYQQAVTSMLENGVKKMGLAGNTLAEAEGTYTGSLGMLKSAWGNLMPALIQGGDIFDEAVQNVVNSASAFGKQLLPKIETALGGITKLIEKLMPEIEKAMPELVETILPSLVKAATSLVVGLIKALPSIFGILKTEIPKAFVEVFKSIGDVFGEQFPIVKTFTDFCANNAGGVAKFTGVIIGLVAAFKGFKAIQNIKGVFSIFGKGKGDGAGEQEGGATSSLNPFKELAKTSPKIVLKGMLNLAIILGGVTILTAAFMAVAPHMAKLSDAKSLIKVISVVAVLGAVGLALAKFAGIVGKIPVATVAKGLANMAIMIGGMSVLYLAVGAVSLINFDLNKVMNIVTIIGVLGLVGGALSVFAGIVGLIPIPVVLLGLANMGLVLGGITTLIVAFGALTKIKGFTEFIEKGGAVLVKICDIIGQMAGSLIGGAMEGISKSLPAIGESIGQFGENIKPLFTSIGGVDMAGVGTFFTSLVGLIGMATGNDIIEGIKSFFGGGESESPLSKLGTELTNFATNAKGFFTTIQAIPAESFPKATELFKSLAKIKDIPNANTDGKTAIAAIANDLSTFNNKTSGFFVAVKNYDLNKVNQLWDSLKNANGISSEALKSVGKDVDGIVKKVTDLPKKMGEGLKSSGSNLTTALVKIWKDAVIETAKPVNKLIEGANWILKEFGSTKEVVSWTPYANGTNGHKGGNALVNDGRGAELVQMPNGRAFLPQGRNVFIPNAPKGMKVLPADRTAQLMGKSSPTFKYAKGTGNIDIWDYIDNAKGLIGAVNDKFVSYNGMSKFALNIGKGMVSTISSEMTSWAKKLYDEMGVLSLAAYNPSKGVEQWRTTVIRALKMEGQYSAANVARTLFQMQTESGGNPRAINLWDSNAKKGIPSKGLMQVIDPTFKAYARAGFNKNIYDPLSNILASIRYAVARYGSLAKAYTGKGYANGGIATKPSIFGERGAEMAIPLSLNKRKRALNLYNETGRRLGVSSRVEHNEYSPQFVLNINGSNDVRETERNVKRWVSEAMDEVFESMARKSPRLQEV